MVPPVGHIDYAQGVTPINHAFLNVEGGIRIYGGLQDTGVEGLVPLHPKIQFPVVPYVCCSSRYRSRIQCYSVKDIIYTVYQYMLYVGVVKKRCTAKKG